MASVVSTLREHLEAIRDRHYRTKYDECGWCCGGFPCPNYTDAMAALAILDAAAPSDVLPGHKLVLDLIPDPPAAS